MQYLDMFLPVIMQNESNYYSHSNVKYFFDKLKESDFEH